MGTLETLLGRRVYIDTNIFIYAFEGYEPKADFLTQLLLALQPSSFVAITSELTLAEMLVGPFQANRPDAVSRYDDFLRTSENLTVVPVGRAVLIGAARQRARLRLLMPDAIHVATALEAGCDVFLTNDRRLRLPPELALHLI